MSAVFAGAFWAFDLAAQFLLPAAYGALLISLACVGLLLFHHRGRRLTALLAGAGLALFLTIQLSLHHTEPPIPAGTPPALSVYQHNIWIQNPDTGAAVDAIKAADADIVAIVEAMPAKLTPFEQPLSLQWPYEASGKTPPGVYARLRLLSKYEILDSDIFYPDQSPAMLRARIRTPSDDLTFIVVHFTRPWPFERPRAQMDQLAGLKALLNEHQDEAIVLVGDFNSAPWGRLARPLQREYDLHLVNHPALGTWPGRLPDAGKANTLSWPRRAAIPIDMSFCSAALTCRNHQVGGTHGSDHRAVRFDVHLPRPQ